MNLARTNLTRSFRVKPLLRSLGLPDSARWPEVSRAIKKRLVEARRIGNDVLAAELSGIKAFLKRNVKGECRTCGTVIGAQHLDCTIHDRHK